MKLTKPEYNENVVDVDALEKHRIQQEAETERTLILEQEKTKRENVDAQEQTKRGDNYIEVLKARVELQKAPPPVCPPVPECPKVSCQAVPVKN